MNATPFWKTTQATERCTLATKIGDHTLDGPYESTERSEDQAGLYTILCDRMNRYNVLDVSKSVTVKSGVETHDRKTYWTRYWTNAIMFAVYYTPHLLK